MIFQPGQRVVFFHAHPDDETLATGALIAALVAAGHPVAVVTATRGERGSVTEELSALSGSALVAQRECELRRALEDLGVTERAWLGTPPARAAGLAPRRYLDSGMVWLTASVAGPDPTASIDALSRAPVAEAAADLAAFLSAFAADVVVSYDQAGGYGHPDHVACHHIARQAAGEIGFVQIVSDADDSTEVVSLDHPEQEQRLRTALADYPSQFRVAGAEVIHVGGQRQLISTVCRLR